MTWCDVHFPFEPESHTHIHMNSLASLYRWLFNIHDQFNGKFNALFSARTGNMLPREYASHALHITIHLFMFTICCSLHVAVSNIFSQLITDKLQLLRSDENSHLKWAQALTPNKNWWEQKKTVHESISICIHSFGFARWKRHTPSAENQAKNRWN